MMFQTETGGMRAGAKGNLIQQDFLRKKTFRMKTANLKGAKSENKRKKSSETHIQKGIFRKVTRNARKHARWPAATCGFN